MTGRKPAGRSAFLRIDRWRAVAAGFLISGLLSGCSGSSAPSEHATAEANVINVSASSCGTGWQHPTVGVQTLQINNTSTVTVEVQLVDPANGGVYAQIEGIGPNTTRSIPVNVGSGQYSFVCSGSNYGTLTGPVIQIPGRVSGGVAILPLNLDQLNSITAQAHAYVANGLAALGAADRRARCRHPRRQPVRSPDGLADRPSHLERLGSAYGMFGSYDDEIDGLPFGLAGGANDPGFTGFYRLNTACGTASPLPNSPRRQPAHRRGASPACRLARHRTPDNPGRGRPSPAHTRGPGGRHAEPAQRAGRFRQRHDAGHLRGRHRRHLEPNCSSCTRTWQPATRRHPPCTARWISSSASSTRKRPAAAGRPPAISPPPSGNSSTRRPARRWNYSRRSRSCSNKKGSCHERAWPTGDSCPCCLDTSTRARAAVPSRPGGAGQPGRRSFLRGVLGAGAVGRPWAWHGMCGPARAASTSPAAGRCTGRPIRKRLLPAYRSTAFTKRASCPRRSGRPSHWPST